MQRRVLQTVPFYFGFHQLWIFYGFELNIILWLLFLEFAFEEWLDVLVLEFVNYFMSAPGFRTLFADQRLQRKPVNMDYLASVGFNIVMRNVIKLLLVL